MKAKDKITLNKVTHSVRASQAVLQYGVGAMVDFPEQTLMTAAPETWENSVMQIHDERLEKLLNVDYFGMPGSADESKYQQGVSYTRFPEWYFCPKCRRFKPLKEWIEEYNTSSNQSIKKRRETDPNMINKLKCSACLQDLVVARIIVACEKGHIDDFPWVNWVHAKDVTGYKTICNKPSLKFTTSASSTEGLEGLTVTCMTCGRKTTLKGAFDKDALKRLDEDTSLPYGFRCSGRHPWKNAREKCCEYPHVLQRGGSSVYFPITMSSLVIPPYSSILTELVENSNGIKEMRQDIRTTIKTLKEYNISLTPEMKEIKIKEKINEFANKISLEIGKNEEQIKAILIRKFCSSDEKENSTNSMKYRADEYVALNGEVTLVENDGEFIRESIDISQYTIPCVKNVSLVHKVKEVQALKGFSRIKPVDSDNLSKAERILPVCIKEDETNWYPGYEIRGEGIFIEIDEDAIDRWRSLNTKIRNRVDLINENYKKSYYGSIKERVVTEKFLLLHTLSHLLMKQLSFECGYNIASLKERIYCSEASEGRAMSGIFIYTACGDSEGTMGGLVRQGRPDVFSEIFKKAIESAVTCSNDPVCSLSLGQGRDSLNLAACYSCTLVPETSCEELNVFLDRGVIIGTYENPEIGFFSSYIGNGGEYSTSSQSVKKSADDTLEVEPLVICDWGMDLAGMNYRQIWSNIAQFSDNNDEIKLLTELMEKEALFNKLELPHKNATFSMGENINLNVDLLWPLSKTMYFSADNQEEYQLAKRSNWNCIFGCDSSITCDDIVKHIKEK